MNEIKRIIFSGLQILIEKKWVTDQAVVVEENKIKAIIPAEMIRHHLPALHHEFSSDHYLIPGLIDLHVHGANGKDIMDASEEAFMAIRLALAAEGVTGFLATTMTADNERIEAVLKAIPGAMAQEEGAAIYGVHLEGPFISASKSGAQRREDVQVPDISLFQNWQSLANGAIRLVTLAPELPGAIPFIKSLHNMDVITSIGHTNATYEETIAAIAAGCTQATHLFNAMSGLHQRHPGAVGALLLANDVYAEIITDGLHLHPAVVEIALQMKGKDRLLLVTDAMRAKCLGDGHFDLGGQQVEVKKGRAALTDGTIAGSTLRMPQAIMNMAKFSHCSLIDAIQMATFNPAHVLGLSLHKGDISVGKDADLVVCNKDFDVLLTMREGKNIFVL